MTTQLDLAAMKSTALRVPTATAVNRSGRFFFWVAPTRGTRQEAIADGEAIGETRENALKLIAEVERLRAELAATETCDHGKRQDEECEACAHDRYSDGISDRERL